MKYFYEIVDVSDNEQKLLGPLDNIYYIVPSVNHSFSALSGEYKYIQTVGGRPQRAFKKSEILATTQKIEITDILEE